MAGIANPGLLLRTCTTSIFNKIKDKSDTTLYFVTPDVNNDLAGVTNMQTVSLYRGANIIEDSNVIFVRDYNLPTYVDADSETIYYRHHCMESHAQSLTSTITGAPGQKLYVLFIDSAPESPTYNQIIDAFMYIWQTEISSVDSQQFTAKIKSATITETLANGDERNTSEFKELNGVWTIEDIDLYEHNPETGLGTFKGTLTCRDKKLGDAGVLEIVLEDVTPGVKIVQNYLDATTKDFLTTSNVTGTADIVLKHSPMVRGSAQIVSAEQTQTHEVIKAGQTHTTYAPIVSGSIYLDGELVSDDTLVFKNLDTGELADNLVGKDVTYKFTIIYTDNGVGQIVFNNVPYGTIDYNRGTLTFNKSFSGITSIAFVRNGIKSISYKAASGTLVLNITKTTETNSDGEILPDIFTLYTGHATDAKSVLETDHDVLTSNGCWLGFCIKNDTTDLFQIIDRVYYEIKHVENELVHHYEAIQEHRQIYQPTKIDYKTYEVEQYEETDHFGNKHCYTVLDEATGTPKLKETARIVIDGTSGNLTVGSNTNTNYITEYLTDDSINLTNKGPIVPYSVAITVKDLSATPSTIELRDSTPWYFRSTRYDEICEHKITQETISGDTVTEYHTYELGNTSIAKQSIYLELTVSDLEFLTLRDNENGELITKLNGTETSVGTVNYTTGTIDITKLVHEKGITPVEAKVTYDYYAAGSNAGTLVDANNNYWGTIDYSTGKINGDLAEVIERINKTPAIADKVIVTYAYIDNPEDDRPVDTLYLDITPKRTAFYQVGKDPYISNTGFWVINNTVTDFKAEDYPEIIPVANADGYWHFNGNQTDFQVAPANEHQPATTLIDNIGNIYTMGDIESNNHYPNTADTYDIGKVDNRWDTMYTDVLDARDLAKTPIVEVQDIVPYAAESSDVNIGTRLGNVEATNVNIESSDKVNIKSVDAINITESKDINLKSTDLINAETKNVTVLGTTKVDITSTDISLFDTAGITLLHINKDGSEFHNSIIKFQAEDGQITSGTHISNKDATYNFGSSDNRWKDAWLVTADARDLIKSPVTRTRDILPYKSGASDTTINIGGEEATEINISSNDTLNIDSTKTINIQTTETDLNSTTLVKITTPVVNILNNSSIHLLDIDSDSIAFYTDLLTVDSTNSVIKSISHVPNLHVTYDLGTNDKRWKSIYSKESKLTDLYVDTIQTDISDVITINDNVIAKDINPHENNTYDLGSNENRWKSIYGENSRWTNLYTDTIQSDTADTVDVNSTLETQDIRPHTDNTYDLGNSDTAYKNINTYNLNVNNVKALNADKINIESDTDIAEKLNVQKSVSFEADLIVQDDATFKSNIQVDYTAAVKDLTAQTAIISETAEFKDSDGNYIIGDTPASLVVIGEEGVDKREENTLLGVKSTVIGADTDAMSDFTMHGIKKYLDYTADTLAQVIFVDCPTEEDDIEAINSKTFELEIQPVESNIAIVRRLIATDTNGTESVMDDIDRYAYTGYVYTLERDEDGNIWPIWQAMTGNYSAKNVYFTQDFTFTKPVGVVTQKNIDDNNGYAVRRAAGVSLQEFMSDLFSEASDPNVTNPNYTLSASATTSGDDEVGTYITALKWSGTFSAGSYPYGSVAATDESIRYTDKGTGVTVNSYAVSSNKAGTASAQAASGTWALTNNITIDTVGSKNYATVSVTCNTNASPRIPVNNLHSPVSRLQIGAKSISKTANVSVSGHRKMFYGSDLSKDPNLSSDSIRNLSGKKVAPSSADSSIIKVDVIENAKSIIVALPKGLYVNTLVNPNSLQDITKVAGVMTTYIEDAKDNNAIDVEGANHFTAAKYNVFVYKSNALLSESKYEMTLTNERPAWLDS